MAYQRQSRDNLWLFAFLTLLAVVQAAKILLLPMQTYSGCVEMSAIGEELSKRGHNLSIFLMSNVNDRKCYGNVGIRPLKFRAPSGPSAPKSPEKIFDHVIDLLKDNEEASFSTHMDVIREMIDYHCSILTSDTRMWKQFRTEKFDFAIVEGSYFTYCYFLIPFKLRLPYAAYSTVFEEFLLNSPFLPSLVPSPFSHETDSMSLFQRIKNTYRQLYTHIAVRQAIPSNVIARVAPELSTRALLQLVSKSDIFLQNTHPILGYPLPRTPNHVHIGGVTTRPGRPLPLDLQNFCKSVKGGLIVMSLGATVKDLPVPLKHKLLRVLYRLSVPVLWKHTQESDNRNVKSVKWFPQNDLLANPKTKLFISHCGSNSIFEALYHGVPVVCLPLYGDQFYNAARIERWRVGLSLSVLYASEDVMFSTLSYALHNASFKANMYLASNIFRSFQDNPRERASFWIEHVMKFGGKHLRSRSLDMSVITCLGYDVFVIFLVLFAGIQFLIYKGFRFAQAQWLLWQEQKAKSS